MPYTIVFVIFGMSLIAADILLNRRRDARWEYDRRHPRRWDRLSQAHPVTYRATIQRTMRKWGRVDGIYAMFWRQPNNQ